MIEFFTSHIFLVLWGSSLGILILLTVIVILKKDIISTIDSFRSILEEIKNKIFGQNLPLNDIFEIKKELLEFKDTFTSGRTGLFTVLTNIQDTQIQILDKLKEHDNRLTKHATKIEDATFNQSEIDINELVQDFADTISSKIKTKKIDKLVGK